MVEPAIEEFNYISTCLSTLIRRIPVEAQMNDNIHSLLLWGPVQASNILRETVGAIWLHPWEDRILLDSQEPCVFTISPWKTDLSLQLSAATAHGCAAMLIASCWETIFDPAMGFDDSSHSSKDVVAWHNYVSRFIDTNRVPLTKKFRVIVDEMNSPDWLRLAATMDIERNSITKTSRGRDKTRKEENKLPENPDTLELIKFLKRNRASFATDIQCIREFCDRHQIQKDPETMRREAARFAWYWKP
ncbi:hypothetical protein [Schlesneria sp. DSM 10557]|uniref:hypothetical protein n=1 Tax=Schlesneria sp. DSM 10557 TaxID=3044399 RepID=UPI0035A121D4